MANELKMKDIDNLVSGTIRECAPMILPPSAYKKFMDMHTPEAIHKAEFFRLKEQARLAEIEAAKTPAQRLKEKQEACDHRFPHKHIYRQKCVNCKKLYSGAAVKAYREGHSKGYDAGRDSVECDT